MFPKPGSWEEKLQRQQKWYDPLKFHEAWYFMNRATFAKMPISRVLLDLPGRNFKIVRSRKHQTSDDALRNFKDAFTDIRTDGHGREYHMPKRPLRDNAVPIAGPVVCKRCGRGPTTMVVWGDEEGPRPRRLERDHIVGLQYGGKDVSENLQWLCYVCHKFKTAEEEILNRLESTRVAAEPWRRRMWEHRLKVLKERNPPGKEHYSWYINDPSTAYERFYERTRKVRVARPVEQMQLV